MFHKILSVILGILGCIIIFAGVLLSAYLHSQISIINAEMSTILFASTLLSTCAMGLALIVLSITLSKVSKMQESQKYLITLVEDSIEDATH